MPFTEGEAVGPYRVVEQLGKGGMATVFKAYHPALDRYVAIKAMHPAFMEDPNFLARFQREAQVVAKLEHVHIVPIYDYSEHEGRPYLVMKFIAGETLKARLSRGPLDPVETKNIVEAVGSALSYAHERGILHRDIKPSNVLLAEDGKIYLADFGLARIAEAGQSTLSGDMMLGTPQYISPEQAMGKRELNVGTDIYSFGVMLYEIAAGQVPFSADTPYSIIHDHIYTPLPLPRTINPAVEEAVERVLLKALAKNPDDRFQHINELSAAFLKAVNGQPAPEASVPGADDATVGMANEAVASEPAVNGPGAVPGTEMLVDTPIFEPPPVMAADESPGEPARRRWRWWYAVPIVALLCICGLIAVSLGQEARSNNAAAPDGGPSAATDGPGVDQPPPDALPPGDPIAAAIQRVEENPEDPFARLELALLLWEQGNTSEIQGLMEEAAELAGEDNVDFYLTAGHELFAREMWLFAATAYLRAAEAAPRGLPPEDRDRIELAVYLAAEDPGARVIFNPADRYAGVNFLLIDTARARFQLYQGNPPLAQAMLDTVLEREPEFRPAHLLQAELHLSQGEVDPAIEILDRLIHTEEPPVWVRAVAETILSEL